MITKKVKIAMPDAMRILLAGFNAIIQDLVDTCSAIK
jgi:hypothetical protein